MRIALTQKELLVLINDYIKVGPKVDMVSIEVETDNGLKDNIAFSDDNLWFVGSFIEEEIKNKDRR